jgi:Putative adhesin
MQQSFEVQGPVELDVRLASGEIEVEAIEGLTRVEIEVIAHDDESQQLVDATRIELHDHHDRPEIIVDVPQRRGSFNLGMLFGRQGITCRLRAPERSGLSVRSKSADVRAIGTLGGANVQTASGDVRLEDVDGGLNVKSASGDIVAQEITSGANIQTASGDVSLDVVRGPVNAATASGDLRIGEAWNNVNANTVSGDQLHGAVLQGLVAAHSVSGDVQIGVRRGSKVFLDCNTVSGDTRSELELTTEAPAGDGPLVEIRAKTVSGDIAITRAPAPADNAQEVHA